MTEKNEMRCPECGRVVPTFDVICPECGNFIDDTELEELPDEEQEASDSFEEEYQAMYQDDEDIRPFRNLHSNDEMRRFDNIVEGLRAACKQFEEKHNEIKHIYRCRKKLEGAIVQSFAGNIYTQHCKKARGIHWLRNVLNCLSRGVPTDWQEDWDRDYFKRVLGWLSFDKKSRENILHLVETW